MIARKEYKTLPGDPGCYLFKDEDREVLYVGKAKNLKKRVSSYFTKKDHDPKTALLVKHIAFIDFFVTKNEVEALILENNLIKKHYPRYNIDLKDSRRYAYLRLSNDELPTLSVARTRDEPGEYFGPFVSGKYRKEIQKILNRYFGILTKKPSGLRKKSVSKEDYKKQVTQARKILGGKVNTLIKTLEKQMDEAAKHTHYEHAMTLRNQVAALRSLREKQNMELRRNYEADIINYVQYGDSVYLLLFNIYKGVLENKQEFEFSYTETFLEEFLVQYYLEHDLPEELIIPDALDESVKTFLAQQRDKHLEITVPQKGAKKALLDLAKKNALLSFHAEKTRVFDLQTSLGLSKPPSIIECFDISHLRGTHTVASMVVFHDGKPYKSHYRKFRIRQETQGDDYAAMEEVIHRRYAKSLRETIPLPDLIVIDGGKGQLSSAEKILKQLQIKTPVISLAKRLEEIYVPGKTEPLQLPYKNSGLLLLRAIRDEAHRFAISYNRLLRKKAVRK